MINKDLLKRIKLIVFDLDGTLLNDDGNIGGETLDLIGQLNELGVKFSFATGRQHSAVTKYAELLGISAPIISLDGSLIKTYPDKEVIFMSYIPEKYVARAIRLSDKYLMKISLCHDDSIYYTEENSLIPGLLEKYGAVYQEVEDYRDHLYQTLEIMLAGEYKDAMRHIENKMIFPYTFGLATSFYKSHSHPGVYYLEIRKQGSSKGFALKRLTDYMNIKIKETAVMGDWYNDKSLFETKAMKIAIANAVPEIKRLADFITRRTNNEDGTAEFLNMVLQSKKKKYDN
ncbi:Cof-type HAD-IIB family hydrolase [Bacteroidota bacterium]